jgi:hypothetical protein
MCIVVVMEAGEQVAGGFVSGEPVPIARRLAPALSARMQPTTAAAQPAHEPCHSPPPVLKAMPSLSFSLSSPGDYRYVSSKRNPR